MAIHFDSFYAAFNSLNEKNELNRESVETEIKRFDQHVSSLTKDEKAEEYLAIIMLLRKHYKDKQYQSLKPILLQYIKTYSELQIALLKDSANSNEIRSEIHAKEIAEDNSKFREAHRALNFYKSATNKEKSDSTELYETEELSYMQSVKAQLYLLGATLTPSEKANACRELSRIYTRLNGVAINLQKDTEAKQYSSDAVRYAGEIKDFLQADSAKTIIPGYGRHVEMSSLTKDPNLILQTYLASLNKVFLIKQTEYNQKPVETHQYLKNKAINYISISMNNSTEPVEVLKSIEDYLGIKNPEHKSEIDELKRSGRLQTMMGTDSNTYTAIIKATWVFRNELASLPNTTLDPIPEALEKDYAKNGLINNKTNTKLGLQ